MEAILGFRRDCATYYADGLGSIRLLTNETGSVTDRTTFEAFGEIDAAASSQASGNAFLYTGEQRDLNRPGFRRHQSAINYGSDGGVCEREAVHR